MLGLEAKWSFYEKNASDLVLCSILSFRSEIVTLRFSLNFEMLTKQKLILGSSILHNFSLSSLWNQNLIGIWAIIWFFELLEPRFFWSNLSFSFCMYVHVRLFGKITSLMDTLYIYFFMWKFISAQRVSLYSKYCNTSQATSMEKPEKDENWSWITVNFGSAGRAELEDLKAQCLRAPPYAACHEALWRKLQV